ncbi:MAG: hypothetical protein DME05_07040 [Candidatus Rokuibacteriota bacterium]|nr:MAG: hypothetical protein DME05_07040 [Candidatus Rokubacteria bacterium]
MTGFRFFTTLLLLTMIAMVAAPSGGQTPSPEGQTFTFPWPPDWVARGKYQKMVLRGITGFNPGQWDVHACGTLPDCLMPASPQFNGLVYHNPVNPDEIVCDLCESWTVSRDGRIYTFRLRQAQWHDGQPVTPEDIKFSLDRIVEPGAIRVRTGVLRSFYEHQSAQVVDDKTIKVPIKFASPLFLENLASEYMKMYPRHVAQKLSPEDAQKPGKLIGSGPWKLKEFKPNISMQHQLLQEGVAVLRGHDLHDRSRLQPSPGGDAGGPGPHHRGADHRIVRKRRPAADAAGDQGPREGHLHSRSRADLPGLPHEQAALSRSARASGGVPGRGPA